MEQFSKCHSLNAKDEFMGKKRDADVPLTKAPLFHVYIGEGLIAYFFVNVKGTLTLNETCVKIWNTKVPETIEGIVVGPHFDLALILLSGHVIDSIERLSVSGTISVHMNHGPEDHLFHSS